jgi:hypothetical protein
MTKRSFFCTTAPRPRIHAAFGVAVLAMLASAAGCSNTRLDFPEQKVVAPQVDDELTFTGQFCASPAANVAYPVKVMFIVDGSGSLQFSDQNRQRVVAVEETINALIGQPNIYFKVIVFNAAVRSTPPTNVSPVFTNDLNALTPALANLAEADTLTDYQGALAVAYAELLRDMDGVRGDASRGTAELGRTKYVLIFISDGMPDPVCQVGVGNDFDPNFPGQLNRLCENQDFLSCLMQAQGTTCSNGVCDFNGTRCYAVQNAQFLFGGLATSDIVAGSDYNQPYQILSKVDDIMKLGERFDVGELRLHTGLVLDPQADPAVLAVFGDPTRAVPIMQQMAASGEGSYMQFYGGDNIDFLSINFEAIRQPRVVRGFWLENRAAAVTTAGVVADSDFDGMPDADEFTLGLSPQKADSDGDGYSDAFEYRRRGFGYNPLDPCMPAIVDVPGVDPKTPCDPKAPMNCNFVYGPDPRTGATVRIYVDSDRDGLNDCEERAIGTDPNNPDTDHDGMLDGEEFLLGTDPLVWDAERDDDQDGIANVREVEWHLHPMVQQNSDVIARDRYRYERTEGASLADGRACFDFTVRRVRLTPTSGAEGGALVLGTNDIRLFILESMADNLAGAPLVREACVRARYVPPSLKVPENGQVKVGIEPDAVANFRYLPSSDPIFADPQINAPLFDPRHDCVTLQ